jgi:hypothetical protein
VRTLQLTLCLLIAGIVAAFPAAAVADSPVAQQSVALPESAPQSDTVPPPGFTTNAKQARAIARQTPAGRKTLRAHPGVTVEALVWANRYWDVDFYDSTTIRAEVQVDPRGHVFASYNGLKARVGFARGHFGEIFDNPLVWLTFGLLFLLPFVDVRRPKRLLHLDLAVLLSFGVSYALFTHGRAEASVWMVYPPLLYLLGRMLLLGFGKGRPTGKAIPHLPTAVLAIGLLLLVGGRVALNLGYDKVIDVGYASVVGADRVAHKQELYVDNDVHGDTYGPLNYIAYVPFEIAFPWKGRWDYLPAAHAASIFFDLMTILGLFILGSRLRAGPEGKRLGFALAWGWAAFPFTLLNLLQNTNDGLIAMLLVYALVASTAPAARGALLGSATAAKFMPGALLPVFMSAGPRKTRREAILTAVACIGVFAFAIAIYLPPGGIREVWDCTLGFQLSRVPDFSLWAIVDGLGWTQKVLEVVAIGLAVALGIFPRGERRLYQTAALAAAVTIALQLPAGHWFYFYIVWFVPLVLVALMSAAEQPERKIAPTSSWTHVPLKVPTPVGR